MIKDQVGTSSPRKPLRLWPGVVIVVLQWLLRFVLPVVAPESGPIGVLGGLAAALALVIWWIFFSRVSWQERVGAVVLMGIGLAVTPILLHESMASGAMGMLFFIYAVPVLCLAFVLWAWLSRSWPDGLRRWTMAATILLACGVWTLFKTGGFTSDFDSDFHFRWAATAEDRLLAEDSEGSQAGPSSFAAAGPSWPSFRGPNRDSVIRGTSIDTDWAASPPQEIWRRSVGPGWSSFAVSGNFLFTQEQRGEEEVVSCYSLVTGVLVWRHGDSTRFWESNAGAGPRGTPTLRDGRVYTLGATGRVNALKASDGSVIWSRDAAADTKVKVPVWGFSGSPLVFEDLVLVPVSGALVAYDRATGEPRWFGPAGGEGYSSPHLLNLGGVEQVLQLSGDGLIGVSPRDGTVLWEHSWSGYPIVQPAQTVNGDVLVSVSDSSGLRRLSIDKSSGSWQVEERWSSIRLKPYFNDFVIHEGHAYGFDGTILASVDVENGERDWKGGRYGGGQLVLLADQDLLLVLSEKGELALVSATPDGYQELARVPAIEGKTWNHPVLVEDVLLVRNSEEMAAFRLPRFSSRAGL